MSYLIAKGAAILVLFAMTWLAARRFDAKQRERGRWDEYGPLVETEKPPREAARPWWDMSERLEVVGRWKGRVLRRRLPGEKP